MKSDSLSASKEDERVCLWPCLHKDTKEVLHKGRYRGVELGQLTTDPLRTRAGGEQATQFLTENRRTTAYKVFKRATDTAHNIVPIADGIGRPEYSGRPDFQTGRDSTAPKMAGRASQWSTMLKVS